MGGRAKFLATLRDSRELIALQLMMITAAVGLLALWLTILWGRDWVYARPVRRNKVVVALVAGLTAGAYWISKMDLPPHDAGERRALLFWIALLLAPAILALRYLWVLVIRTRTFKSRMANL
jgi:hypothetical protein